MLSNKNADFSQIISSVQNLVQGFGEIQKMSQTKLLSALSETASKLTGSSRENRENTHFQLKVQQLLQDMSAQRPALGTTLIYGSRSSHLLRLIPVFHALKSRCAVLFFCDIHEFEVYEKLLSLFIAQGLPEQSLILVATEDPEALETLVLHPSLKSLHFNGHFYEGAFLKSLALPLFKKRIRIHLGGRNPVIFTHDAPLDLIPELLNVALDSDYLAEHSFNRWFVQEKNYADFVKHVEELLPQVLLKKSPTNLSFQSALQKQNQGLLKEKNWKSGNIFYNLDFNNCSPWQQQEVLGNILTITRFKNTAEAIKFSNTTHYASAAGVFSGSLEKSMEISQQLIMPHHFSQTIPDMGALSEVRGLSETGFGQNVSDKDFFIY